MVSHDCYTVKAQSFLPAYNLAHSLRSASCIRGLVWAPYENKVAFQAVSMFTEADVEVLVRLVAGDGCEMTAIGAPEYELICQVSCMAMTEPTMK